jgi:hypothetical protein
MLGCFFQFQVVRLASAPAISLTFVVNGQLQILENAPYGFIA